MTDKTTYWTTKQHQDWTHPADTVRIIEQNETMEHTIHIYTDGSKTEQGVGSANAIYVNDKLTHQVKHKLKTGAQTIKLSRQQYSKHYMHLKQ